MLDVLFVFTTIRALIHANVYTCWPLLCVNTSCMWWSCHIPPARSRRCPSRPGRSGHGGGGWGGWGRGCAAGARAALFDVHVCEWKGGLEGMCVLSMLICMHGHTCMHDACTSIHLSPFIYLCIYISATHRPPACAGRRAWRPRRECGHLGGRSASSRGRAVVCGWGGEGGQREGVVLEL